jgi:hypothetical protein
MYLLVKVKRLLGRFQEVQNHQTINRESFLEKIKSTKNFLTFLYNTNRQLLVNRKLPIYL